MFEEVVKLTPQIDRATLASMFRTLNQRFGDVARRFGNGLKNALRLTPLFALAGAGLAKLLNPLQAAEEIINRILDKGDAATTDAREFGSTPGNLLRLQALAGAKGLEAETLRQLLGKFQIALSREQEAAKDPAGPRGLLREFIGETDVAEAFFAFVQSLKDLEPSQRVLAETQIFGEGERVKASEFFQGVDDFASILARLPSSQALNEAATATGRLGDQRDLEREIRTLEDFVAKADQLDQQGPSLLGGIDEAERLRLRAEDETLARFDDLKTASIATQELTAKFDRFATQLVSDLGPRLVTGIDTLTSVVGTLTPYLQTLANWTSTALDGTVSAIRSLGSTIDGYFTELKNSRLFKYFGR